MIHRFKRRDVLREKLLDAREAFTMALLPVVTRVDSEQEGRMASWAEIKEAVEKNGNVMTVTMEKLRDAHGAAKLGVNVRAEITSTLAGMGLGHVPQALPSYQNEQVRVYKNGTPVGDLINTVLTPGEQSDSKLTAQFGTGGVDMSAIIEKIRELVTE